MTEFISTSVSNPPTKRLYVFLHGLVCLVDLKAGEFDAYLPDMADEHKCLCGNWLLEQTVYPKDALHPLQAQLKGVNSGPGQLDPVLNPILRLSAPFSPDLQASPIKAKFHLPRPNAIISHFVQGKLQPNAFKGDVSKFNTPPNIVSGLRVFQYDLIDEKQVQILEQGTNNVVWQCPDLAVVSGGNYAVAAVHIYNEPDQPLDNPDDHARREFNQSLKLLGANITLDNPAVIPQTDPNPFPGFLPGETSTLDSRLDGGLKILVPARSGKFPSGASAGGAGGTQVCGGANGQIFP